MKLLGNAKTVKGCRIKRATIYNRKTVYCDTLHHDFSQKHSI